MWDRIDSSVFSKLRCKDSIYNTGNDVRHWAWEEGWIKSQPILYIFCGFISVCCSEINHSTRSKSPFRRVMIEQQFWFWKKQVHRQLFEICRSLHCKYILFGISTFVRCISMQIFSTDSNLVVCSLLSVLLNIVVWNFLKSVYISN